MVTFSMIVMRAALCARRAEAARVTDTRGVHMAVAAWSVAVFTALAPRLRARRVNGTSTFHSTAGRSASIASRCRRTTTSRELTSEAHFRVRFLFIDAYRYEHRARERWQGDCLESLEARTDTNGKPPWSPASAPAASSACQSGSARRTA